MGALVGLRGQKFNDHFFDASGTIASGGAAQLLLPISKIRTSFFVQNISDTDMLLEFGSGRATATLTAGAVTSCSVTNAGFGFSRPPSIMFLGGAWDNGSSLPTYALQGAPCWAAPSNVAQAHCVMTGSAPNQTISSIVIDNPGSGYNYPPYVLIMNDPLDPYGCAVPSASVGLKILLAGGSYTSNGSVAVTDQVGIFCASSSKAFTCKYTL